VRDVSDKPAKWLLHGYRAVADGDVAGALALLDPPRRYAPGAKTTLLYALLYALDAVETLEHSTVEFSTTRSDRATVVVLRFRGTGRDAGTAVDFTIAHLWTEDRESIGFQWFNDACAAARAQERWKSRLQPADSTSAGSGSTVSG
jgi:hypothetical protein